MNSLKYKDLHLVKPEFRDLAKKALDNGEAVPNEIMYLNSPGSLSEAEQIKVEELNKKYKFE